MTNKGAESDDHRDETDPKFVADNGHPPYGWDGILLLVCMKCLQETKTHW